jgi:hypothetical protein
MHGGNPQAYWSGKRLAGGFAPQVPLCPFPALRELPHGPLRLGIHHFRIKLGTKNLLEKDSGAVFGELLALVREAGVWAATLHGRSRT